MSEFPEWIERDIGFTDLTYEDAQALHRKLATMSEQEDLENLLKSPGWLRLKDYVQQTWGEQLGQYVTQATGDADDVMALNKLRQVVAAKNAVERLLSWPQERLRHLTEATAREYQTPGLSRRGGL